MPDAMQSVPPSMRPYERWGSVLSHLWTIIPLWAIVANALIYFVYRESSRVVCFHARQGIVFQLVFLLFVVAKLVIDLFAKPLGVIGPLASVPGYIDRAGQIFLLVLFIAYAMVCLVGAAYALRGRIFAYPLIGQALYKGFLRARGN